MVLQFSTVYFLLGTSQEFWIFFVPRNSGPKNKNRNGNRNKDGNKNRNRNGKRNRNSFDGSLFVIEIFYARNISGFCLLSNMNKNGYRNRNRNINRNENKNGNRNGYKNLNRNRDGKRSKNRNRYLVLMVLYFSPEHSLLGTSLNFVDLVMKWK
jgi:hypothetical protein